MKKIRVMIVGYGNVGRGVRLSLGKNPDMELVGIVSRSPERVGKELPDVPVMAISDVEGWKKAFRPDVAILCGGSKNDLPQQGPEFAKYVNTVDSFDNHSRIPEYFADIDAAAKASGHVSVISTGWDPGIFSLERVLGGAFIPGARAYGFYGLGEKGGLSMGHSDALRTIPGVKDARQFTHAIPEAIERVRRGENPAFEPGDMHTRECFVVLEEGADREAVTKTILSMPGYSAPLATAETANWSAICRHRKSRGTSTYSQDTAGWRTSCAGAVSPRLRMERPTLFTSLLMVGKKRNTTKSPRITGVGI